MTLDDAAGRRPDPLDTILFQSPVVVIGAFRVDPGHPRFQDSGPIQRHIVVFPRTFVRIAHAGGDGFLAGPELVTYYNRGQVYRRESVRGLPDRCEWFAFGAETLAEALQRWDPAAAGRPSSPFPFAHGPGDSVSYARQRRIVELLSSGRRADAAAVEEAAIEVLARQLAAAYRVRGGLPRPASPAAIRVERTLAEEAKALLSESLERRRPLADLASALGVSVFRLCRVFRRRTGTTLHAYRNRLRLAASLELLGDDRGDLTRVALDLGYSSHSHFTAAFRREFGNTPSAFRASLAAPAGRAARHHSR
ncbi:MAG TPA: AraC family transcriptional regulator [Thermoanaerobaculia bacterium]|nr:AraC family transcriptional regulator [Thermoanaerobaculia bacterium]